MTVIERIKVGPSRYMGAGSVALFSRYQEGDHTAITLVNEDTGEPLTKVTVNLPDNPPPDRQHVWTKGWAENIGIPRACEKAGLFELLPSYHHIDGTNVMAQLARLTPRAVQQMKAELGE